ncbi:hypothetical protein Tco_0721706 [Tanacetum coccineum]
MAIMTNPVQDSMKEVKAQIEDITKQVKILCLQLQTLDGKTKTTMVHIQSVNGLGSSLVNDNIDEVIPGIYSEREARKKDNFSGAHKVCQESAIALMKKTTDPSVLHTPHIKDSSEVVNNNVGLKALVELSKERVDKIASTNLNEIEDNGLKENEHIGLDGFDELWEQMVDDSSGIEKDTDCVMVLDDDCKETESRVSKMDDNIPQESVVGYNGEQEVRIEAKLKVNAHGMFDKEDGEIKENKERTTLSNLVYGSGEIINGPKESELDKKQYVSLGSQIAAEFIETLYFSPTSIGVNEHKMISNEVCVQKGICSLEICHNLRYVEDQECGNEGGDAAT